MAIKKIYLYPSKMLRQVSKEVALEEIAGSLQLSELVRDMRDTVNASKAAGLSAIQIGVPLRVVFLGQPCFGHPKSDEGDTGFALINPKVVGTTGDLAMAKEGCLSVPGVTANIARHEVVLVSYFDTDGKQQEMKLRGLAAQCIEHELEHLDGKIFVDHFPDRDRNKIKAQTQNFWRQNFKFARKSYSMER